MASLKYSLSQIALKLLNLKWKFTLTGDEFTQHILKNYRNQSKSTNLSGPPDRLRKHLQITDVTMGEKKLYIASSKIKTGGRKVLYIHGGGFVLESQVFQWNGSTKMMLGSEG